MDVELLISLVKTYPILYNKQEKDYKDTLRKDNTWKQIAETLNCSVEECQTQFKSLREKYIRERKAYENRCRSGAGLEDVPNWEWYKEMNYLDTYIKRRRTSTNIKRRLTEEGECSKSQKTENIYHSNDSVLSLDSDSEIANSPMTEIITDHDYGTTDVDEESNCKSPSQMKNECKQKGAKNPNKRGNNNAVNAEEEIVNTMRYLRDITNVR